jgi:hypothetical protein
VLNALADYVNMRAAGPARVEKNGRRYVMQPEMA